MPSFLDGDPDPRDPQPSTGPVVRAALGQPDTNDPFAGPSLPSTLGAAFRQGNPVVSALTAIAAQPGGAVDPTWNPLTLIKGTKYEAGGLDKFLGDQNEAQTRARMASIDREDSDRQTLAASGRSGTVAGLAAGALDPFNYIPVLGEFGAARGVLATAGRMALTGAASTAASETVLQSTQQTRTWQESAGNIASGTLMMGVLGAAHGMLSPAERSAAASALDEARPKMAVDPDTGAASPVNDNAPSGLAQATGAAPTDTRDLTPKSYGFNTTAGIKDVANSVSPNQRVYNGVSIEAKRTLADLAETATRFEQHDEGVPTSLNGAPLESIIRVQKNQAMTQVHDVLKDGWVQHYYGDTPPSALKVAGGLEGIGAPTQGDRLSFADFKDAVSDAGVNGDQHPIPEVQQAVQQLRAQVLDPIKKFAQETKTSDGTPMLSSELDAPAGDKSFWPRQYNRQALISKYNETADRITGWLSDQQTQKAATKERLAELQTRHEAIGGQIDKLDGRLETIQQRQAETATRLKERSVGAGQQADRVDALDQRVGDVGEHMSALGEFIDAMRGQARDPAARARLDDLTREVAALRKGGQPAADAGGELAAARTERQASEDALSQARNDREKTAATQRVEKARLAEAQASERATSRRVQDLVDRQNRQNVANDLLTAARQNAEDMRTALRGKMEDELRGWKGKSTAEAVAALKARDENLRQRGLKQEAGAYEGRGARLTSADGPVDRAVKKILASDRDLSREELASRSREIMDRLIGSPDGRVPYDAASGGPKTGVPGGQEVRGALNAREFAMPTSMFPAGVINRDAEHVLSAHVRTMLPDIHLTARFGDVDLTDAFRRVQDEYSKMVTPEMTEAQRVSLFKKRDSDITDLAAVRDRLRGTYGWNPDASARKLGGLVRDFQNVTALSGLGTSVINRLSDIGANAVFRYGLMNVFHDVWAPLFQGLLRMSPVVGIAKQQTRDMGIGVDGLLGHMRQNLHDVDDSYQAGNRFSRGLAWATDKSMIINGHGPWTDYMKAMNWNVAQAEFGRTAKRIAETGGTKADLQRMADANIDPQMATRISAQYEAHHNAVGRSKFANTGDWTDRAARQAFEAAMSREANINVITAGIGDKPLWLSKPIGGLIGQFKSFTAGAHEKILISNLQQRDGRVLQGALTSLAMGMLSYRLYTLASGQQTSDNPADWIKEAINRSAMTGWLNEGNQLASKFTGGTLDANRLYGATAPLTRRADASPLAEMLGPSYARTEGLAGVVTHAASGTFSANDIHQGRMALPLQNLMGIRILLDKVEDGVSSAFGMKPRSRALGAGMPPH